VIWPIGSMVSTVSILPILVFLAETCVCTICTVRTIFIARGQKGLASLLGFFEVSTWLFAITKVMQNLNRVDCFLAFVIGFTLGNFLGVLLEKKLALGRVVVHLTTRRRAGGLVEELRAAGYGVTTQEARGATGPVQIVFTVIPRRELDALVALLQEFDPDAFYSVHDLQSGAGGITPPSGRWGNGPVPASVRQMFRAVLPASKRRAGGVNSLILEVSSGSRKRTAS
jgi:uncharacterized protein YebE (UPF0316 family)